MPRPMLGSFSGSLGSSCSFSSSMDSPLRERASTWSFVEVPPSIAENQAPSTSGESGFHDMSRQASKTESSESTAECGPGDQVLEEMIKQSAEYGESETSRSSSDTTITPEEQIIEDADHHVKSSASSETSASSHVNGQGNVTSDNQSALSHDIDSSESSVFEEPSSKGDRRVFKGGKSVDDMSAKIVNYDTDFPEILPSSSSAGKSDSVSDKVHCDYSVTNQTVDSSADGKDDRKPDAVSVKCDADIGHPNKGFTKCASDLVRDVAKMEIQSDSDVCVISDIHIRGQEMFSKSKDDIAECIDEAVVEDIGDIQCDEVTHL